MDNINKKTKAYFPIKINEEKAKTHILLNIEGIKIYFPYEPYQLQITYMKKVISTLNKQGSISALESPTGTGKTLCLLCSVLGWILHTGKEISIYYCTRTISQINNVLKEINKTCYDLQISFLASRVHTCLKFDKGKRIKMENQKLNDICLNLRDNLKKMNKGKKEIKKEEEDNYYNEKNNPTNKYKKYNNKKKEIKVEKNQELEICKYYNEEENFDFRNYNNIEDIEDLLKEGKKKLFCPYFYNISKTKNCANLTFMSYNYILDPNIRKKINIFENNSIVILDEAHNICNILENIFSKKINTNELEKMQKLLQIVLDFINESRQPYYKEDDLSNENPLFLLETKQINKEINTIKKFISQIGYIKLEKIKLYKGLDFELMKNIYIFDFEYFKELFKEFQLEFYSEIRTKFSVLNHEYKKELNDFYKTSREYDKNIKLSSLIKLFEKIFNFLHLIKEISPQVKPQDRISKKDIINQVIIKKEKEKLNMNSFRFIFSHDKEKTFFQIVCLDASYGLKLYQKMNPHSTILTSGTLSIDLIENLLNVKFFEKLTNNHVINKNQLCINIINGYSFHNQMINYSFKYKKRNNIEQIISLGNEIYNLVESVKIGGVLVFFQSFEYLEKCYIIWLKNKIIQKYESIKKVFFDLSFNRKYSEKIIRETKKNNNLLLFTVYRGKNSEGINFHDDEARMIICIGMPYPKLSDIKVIFKREYLDQKYKMKNNNFNGWKWYREEAINAVNQSLGRLIRHKNDYGIMICFGIEFSERNIKFTKWINDNISQNSFIRLKENDINYFDGLNTFLSNLNMLFSKKINNQEKNNLYEYADSINEIEDYEYIDDYNLINDNDSEESWEKDKNNSYEKYSYIKENDNNSYGFDTILYKRYRKKYDSDK